MESVRRIGMYRESPGSDIVKQGYLKKLKTMKKKFFVLRATSSSGPARFDYFDNEKKFKTAHPPKKSYHLYTVFNINKRSDSKHKFGIAIFLPNECFSVLADSQEEQEDWMNKMLEYQNEYLPQDEEPRPHYDYVWQGLIKHKSPSSCTKISGPYRLCLSEKAVCLVKVNEYKPSYQFQFSSIRKCGAHEHFFLMEVGRSAVTGSGEIWLEVESSHAAQNMHDIVLTEMAASRQAEDPFRRRSNTGTPCNRDGETYKRKRAVSESHHQHPHGSPRRNRALYTQQRPQSFVHPPHTQPRSGQLAVDAQMPLGSSPSAFDPTFYDEGRIRSDSMGSRSSRGSRHLDMVDHPYENTNPNTPVISPEGSFISARSITPEAQIPEEELSDSEQPDYLSMTPGQRSMTPSPTRSQGQQGGDYLSMTPGQSEKPVGDYLSMTPGQNEKSKDYLPMAPGHAEMSDYLSMTPGHRSATPSPTRFSERLSSIGSNPQSSGGYMDMRPGSAASGHGGGGGQETYMNMTPPKSSSGGYMDMMPTTPPVQNSGYVDMNPGQRTPTDPGPGYVLMDGVCVRSTAPIPIRANKEPSYMDMGPSSQPLPTVKESGSGEAYLPMSPTGTGVLSSDNIKPVKVMSYLSDDSMSGEFPKRAYSVGSRPMSKPSLRYRQPQEVLRHEPLDSSKSSSAPHLIVQKSRFIDVIHRNHHEGHYPASPLSQSVKSDDSDSFTEMEFYRPRTASDSYGCRPRSSSFGKQFITQGHRPRSSSYGQGAKGTMSKLAAGFRQDSFESVRTTSQELSNRQRSQESLGILSSSSRNSSSDSLKKNSDGSQSKKSLQTGEYMDMNYDKHKTQSQNIHGVVSPKKDTSGYMDMSVGTNVSKSLTRGISPCSSTHSLPSAALHSLSSSPASTGHWHSDRLPTAKVIKPSGKVVTQKQTTKGTSPASSENQLKVMTSRLKKADKRSPSSSGKESEDESYVPFQPGSALSSVAQDDLSSKLQTNLSFEMIPKSHPGIKIQHGYSRSHDSGVRSPEPSVKKQEVKPEKSFKGKKDDKNKTKNDEQSSLGDKSRLKSEKKSSEKSSPKSEKQRRSIIGDSPGGKNLQQKAGQDESPGIERKLAYMPDDDLFSNKIFKMNETKQAESGGSTVAKKVDDSAYMEYLPGFDESLNKDKSKESVETFIPKRLADREYCEIDFPQKTDSHEKSKDVKAESDYMEADPAPLNVANKGSVKYESSPVKEKPKGSVEFHESGSLKDKTKALASKPETGWKGLKREPSEDFSYMDFDPATDKKVDEKEKEDCLKSPHRVLSFLAHSLSVEEKRGHGAKSEKDKLKLTECGDECKVENVWVKQSDVGNDRFKDSSSVKSDCQHSASRMCQPCGEHDNVKGERAADSGKDAMSVIGANKENESDVKEAGSVSSKRFSAKERHLGKLIIKQVGPAQLEGEPVHDEGYCDLDFKDVGSEKDQQRTESVSSSNSERGRKVIDSVGSDDSIPCPETPISYISEEGDDIPVPETPLSYISDDSTSGSSVSSREFGSPFKSPLGGRASNPSVGKTSGFGLASFGVSGESLRKSLPATRSHGVMPPSVALSRQSSVPVGPPVISPRSSTEIQHAYRTRKASGPACLSSQGKPGNVATTNNIRQTSQSCLEPNVAGLELHKQKSMPCMNVPQNLDRIKDIESLDHVQSRHSFSDLSQYEEVNMGAGGLSKGNQVKCCSQQQLASDTGSNELHYAELELKGSTENMDGTSPRIVKSRHPSSLDDVSKDNVQYAEIDHLKTEKMKAFNEKDVKFYVS